MGSIENAQAAFRTLVQLWGKWEDTTTGQNFWHVANSLEAALDYADAADLKAGSADLKSLEGMVESAFGTTFAKAYASVGTNLLAYWWDDFAHWGNVSLFLHQYLVEHPDTTSAWTVDNETCLTVAAQSWCMMKACSWDQVGWSGHLPADGCWNYPTGIRNAVTNASYLVLSVQLYDTVKNDPDAWTVVQNAANTCFARIYGTARVSNPTTLQQPAALLQAACDEFNWFDKTNQSNGFMQNCAGGFGGLVNEEALQGSNTFVWSGSQGLFLAGMMILSREQADFGYIENPPNIGNLDNYVATILSNMSQLFYPYAENPEGGVLCEAPFPDNLNNNPIDLGTGKGVFLRFLKYLDSEQKEPFNLKVETTATAVLNAPTTTFDGIPDIIAIEWVKDYGSFQTQFAGWWGQSCSYSNTWTEPDGLLFRIARQTSGLSALVAAVRVTC